MLFFEAGSVIAQPLLLQKKVSVSATEQTISTILYNLGKETGIRFSYDPDLLNIHRKISLEITNKPLETVLRKIFDSADIQFKTVGNQVVIFNPNPTRSPVDGPESPVQIKPPLDNAAKVETSSTGPDTVYIRQTDTLYLVQTDTVTIIRQEEVILHDTVRLTDTVFIHRSMKAGKTDLPRFDKNSMSNRKFREENGWYLGISYEHLFNEPVFKASGTGSDEILKLMDTGSGWSPMNFSLTLFAGYDYYRVGFSTGLGYTRLGEIFEYSYISHTGGYYLKDTVESYYTISGIDTSWYYITDSSYVNIENHEHSYKNPNAYRYIEFPLSIKVRLINNQQWDVYIIPGIVAGIHLGEKALVLLPENDYPVDWIGKSNLNPVLFHWHAGIGASHEISDRIWVMAEVNYRGQFNSQLKNYPLSKKFNLLNMKTGIFVRL